MFLFFKTLQSGGSENINCVSHAFIAIVTRENDLLFDRRSLSPLHPWSLEVRISNMLNSFKGNGKELLGRLKLQSDFKYFKIKDCYWRWAAINSFSMLIEINPWSGLRGGSPNRF